MQGSRRHTWAEFAQRVASLAGALQQLGLAENTRVALLALNSDRYLECLYGIVWAGGIVVPINFRFSVAEIAFCLNDCQAEILIVDDAFHKIAAELRAQAPTLRHTISIGETAPPMEVLAYEQLLTSVMPVEGSAHSGDDVAAILYTGGTTGRSKGVMLTHTNLASMGLNNAGAIGIDETCVYLHAAPMFHVGDITVMLGAVQMAGAHAFVSHFDPRGVLQAIENYRVTYTLLVPTMLHMLLEQLDSCTADLSSLQLVLYGASPMPLSVIQRAMAKLPSVRFMQGYGMTEAVPATFLEARFHTPDGTKLRSAGRAAYFAELKVVDPTDREVPRGTVGEILIRGPMVMKGYWNQPKLTADALRGGWMHTGDAGYMDEDGFLYVVDRLKDMIISGGENVYSAETENAIHSHPAVAMCAVIGIPSQEWVEQVHAIVVPKEGHDLTADEVIGHCKTLIAGYKCPRSVEITREPLPMSGVGKILKRQLRERYAKSTNA